MPLGQTLSQVPQLNGSVLRSVQVPEQSSGRGRTQPGRQDQTPSNCWPQRRFGGSVHATSQAPHWAGVLYGSMQASVSTSEPLSVPASETAPSLASSPGPSAAVVSAGASVTTGGCGLGPVERGVGLFDIARRITAVLSGVSPGGADTGQCRALRSDSGDRTLHSCSGRARGRCNDRDSH